MRGYKLYDIVVCLFVSMLIISNIVAVKIINPFGITLSGAIILFPVTYILSDILTEVYGFKLARRAIWMGFGALGILSLAVTVVGRISPAPFWEGQEAYKSILMSAPRIAMASLLAYFAGEFLNSSVLSRMKVMTQGKHFWARAILSTLAGQGIDSGIFYFLAFMGTMPSGAIGDLIMNSWMAKTLYEALAMPLTYAVVKAMKKAEGVDAYDRGVVYNPFSLSD